jgi:flavin-dependent dehydrogenase
MGRRGGTSRRGLGRPGSGGSRRHWEPGDAWSSWERRGINQARLAHFFLSRFRIILESELPQLIKALTDAGACRYNILSNIPDDMKGGARSSDQTFDLLTGRRVVVEAATARTCDNSPGVTVRRGVVVSGLLTGTEVHTGVPNIVGVELDDGTRVHADLVIDATGRRSRLPTWLDAIGAAPIEEEAHDSGFIYFGRHFRSPDGTLPPMFGPLKQDYGSIGCLTLPADNGTWSVTLTASTKDAAMRAVLDTAKWESVVRLLPGAAHWLDGEPIDDGVAAMAKIEDRIRNFAPNGLPVATGVMAVADSWSCTNPSLGRGASIGMIHAVALRDVLRASTASDPWQLGLDWAEATSRTVKPWYETTSRYDTHRLAEIHAQIDGRLYRTDDEEWKLVHVLETRGLDDADVLRAGLDLGMGLRRPEEIFADVTFKHRASAIAADVGDEPAPGPDRSQLLAVLTT